MLLGRLDLPYGLLVCQNVQEAAAGAAPPRVWSSVRPPAEEPEDKEERGMQCRVDISEVAETGFCWVLTSACALRLSVIDIK